jgi:hypothetical protein
MNLISNVLDPKYYAQIISILFEHVIPSWFICFTTEDQIYLANNFLNNQKIPSYLRLESISATLSKDLIQDPSNSQLIFSTLNALLTNDFNALFSNISSFGASADVYTQIIVSLPDRIANALQQKSVPTEFLPKNYYSTIIANSLEYLKNFKEQKDFLFVSQFLGKLCKLGYHSNFVHIYLEYTVNNNSTTEFAKILKSLPENVIDQVVHHLLTDLSTKMSCGDSSKILLNILQFSLNQSKSLQHFITNKSFVTKIYKKQIIVHLVHFLKEVHSNFPQIEIYSITSVVNNIVNIWRDSLFIRNSNLQLQTSITTSILELLKYMSKEDLLSSQIVPKIIQGVQSRLESPQPPIRNQGMMVATCFSTIIDPTNPLKFDEMTELEEPEKIPKEVTPPVEKKTKTVKKGKI